MICCTFSKNGTPYSDWNFFLTIPSKPMLSHAFHNRIQRNHMVLEIPFIGCFIWDRIFNSKPLELHCLITLASGNYIQCRTINVANLTRYNSLPRQKKFRHDNTIRSLTIWTEEKWLGFTQEVLTWNISLDNFRFWLWNSLKNQFPIDKHNIDNHSRNNTNLNRNYKCSSIKDIFTFFQGLLFWKKVFHF